MGAARRHGQNPAEAVRACEAEQQGTAARVQGANEAIFRDMAVTSPLLAKARSLGLRAAAALPVVERTLTQTEALVDGPTPDLPLGPGRVASC